MRKKYCYILAFFALDFLFYPKLLICVNLRPKSKIAIVSLYDQNYAHIGQYSDENKKRYAEKHGYDLFLYHERLDNSRPGAWSKILAIQNHLKDYDWIYWSDADSLIMNMAIKLEKFIDNKFNMIISKEVSYGELNTGSFLIKNCIWSRSLLKQIYAQTNFVNHRLWEQAALAYLFKKMPTLLTYVKILPQRTLNSNIIYEKWPDGIFKEGDFVLHFYGPCDKEQLMKVWSKKVIND